jgi:hypothetical protein
MKNLFDYATKELEQDAFLLWLFDSWEDKDVQPVVHSLLEAFCGISKDDRIKSINTFAQWKNIDVKIDISTELRPSLHLFIEDKTFSQEHSNQLERYNGCINEVKGEKYTVFYKTSTIEDEERKRVGDAKWTAFNLEDIWKLFHEYGGSPVFLISQYAQHLDDLRSIQNNAEKPESNETRNDMARWVAYFRNTILSQTLHESYDCWGYAFETTYRYACLCFKHKEKKENTTPYLEIRSRDCLNAHFYARVLCYGIDEDLLEEKQPGLISKANESDFWESKYVHGKKGKHPKQVCSHYAKLRDNSDASFIEEANKCIEQYIKLIDEWVHDIDESTDGAPDFTYSPHHENAQDFPELVSNDPYIEPTDFKYYIIKVKPWRLDEMKEKHPDTYRYEATRYCWKIVPRDIKEYPYVFSVTDGIVEEVYRVERWEPVSGRSRYEFFGHPAPDEIRERFVKKRIPDYYRKKGMASPVLFSKN